MSIVHAEYRSVLPLLLLPLFTVAQAFSAPPQPTAIAGATTHVYKSISGVELRLHAFSATSDTSDLRPAIVLFFGGGWTQGSVQQFVPQAKHLAQRGMVAIVADYRVFERYGTSPFEAMADAKSAIRWVRSHSEQLGIDSNRIAAAGGSAGGHIALSAAVFDTFDESGEDETISSRPEALVLFNPAVDTTHATPALMKQRFGDRGGDGSPIHHLGPGLPPTIIFHGTADRTVPYGDVDRFCTQARSGGDQCELIGYEGAPHGFSNPQVAQGKWYRETLLEADRFLTSIGYLEGPVPASIP